MLPNIEYIKTLVNGLKEFVNNKIKLVRKDIDSLPQADWNQNDPTVKDYIKNRTHYVENGYRQEDYLIHVNTSGVSSVEDKEYRNGSIPLAIGEKVQVSFVLGTNGSITYQFAATVVQDANGQEPCIDLKGWPITIYADHAKYSSYWVNNSGTNYVIVTKNVVSRHVRPIDAEYLANGQEKICWTESELTKLYTNDNANFKPKFTAPYFYITTSPSTDSFGLVAGKKYRVIWDEVPYDCTCVSASGYGRDLSWIGSPTLAAPYNEFGSGNSFPFCISTKRDGTKIEDNGAAASRPGKHSFVLYEIGDEIVHKIPDKYISAGSVKYTPQTLNLTQKYQALENISGMPISDSLGEATNIAFVDAVNFNDTTGEAVPNGLLIYRKSFIGGMARYNAIGIDGKTYEIAWNKAGAYSPKIRRVYTGLLDANGHFPQQTMAVAPTEDMQIATKKYVDDHAVGSSEFIVNASLDDNNNCTVDKTYAQIEEAVNAGKKPVVHLANGGSTVTMPLGSGGDGAFIFSVVIGVMETVSALATISVQHGNEVAYIFTYIPALNPSNSTFNQVEMNEDPKEAMQIATKQYVDNKEFILQSTTPNSTKKFKITVDDAGALTAMEVTS